MSIVHELRVRYAETDQMGVVYYANYLVWFELGRVEFLRSLGFDYKQMEIEDGCILPVVEANCRYKAPARYDDKILIDCWPIALRGFLLKFGYRILKAATETEPERLLAEGETTHIACNANLEKCVVPERFAAPIREVMRAAAEQSVQNS